MPGKQTAKRSATKVMSIFELWYVRRIAEFETASVCSYDEPDRHEAEADFQGLCRQAREEIGTERTVPTEEGNDITGLINRIIIELLARKIGDWISPAKPVCREVLLDDSGLSPKARSVRDGLLAVPVGERAALFAEALKGIGTEPPLARDGEYGRVCPRHKRWVGRGDVEDVCWRHVWGSGKEKQG